MDLEGSKKMFGFGSLLSISSLGNQEWMDRRRGLDIWIWIAYLDFFFRKRGWREREGFRNPRMEGSKKGFGYLDWNRFFRNPKMEGSKKGFGYLDCDCFSRFLLWEKEMERRGRV
jgi:hypothetical protein